MVNKNINQVVIPTGNLTGKNGCDSVLYNILNNQMSSIQYKNKMTIVYYLRKNFIQR